MSFKLRLQIAAGAAFLLAATGVNAQTPAVGDERSVSTGATVAVASDPSKPAVAKPSAVQPQDPATLTTTAVNPEVETAANVSAPEAPASFKPRQPILLPPGPVPATDPDTKDRWVFQLTPYFWLAGLHGPVGTDNRQSDLDESFGDIFGDLKFAFMGTFEARRNKIGIVTDLQYVSLESDNGTPGPLFSGVEARVKTFIFDPEGAYRIWEDPEKGAFIDVMGGIRVVKVSSELTFFPGFLPGFVLDASRTWVDGVAGMRAKAHLSPKIFIVGKFDIGGGGSNFTYQLFAAGGYEINKTFALIIGYRDLNINYRKDNFVYDTSQRGPIMGVGIRF